MPEDKTKKEETKTPKAAVIAPKKVTKKPADKVAAVEVDDTDDSSTKKKTDEYLYSVGKRKTAVAQVRVYKKGSGKITVNKKDFEVYFPTLTYQSTVKAPLNIIGQADKLDVTVRVVGGGPIGQAEAIRHGISHALIQLNPNFRKPLKKAGYLTRDARKKERKKPGLKRARRAPQWKKR